MTFFSVLQNGDGIGRANQRPEYQRPGKRHGMPDQYRGKPEAGADDGGRNHGTKQRQNSHWDRAVPQFAEIDMKRTSEQQETKHAVHHDGGEVDLQKRGRERVK